MAIGLILVYALLALIVIITALGMLTAKNAIYSALFLVLNFGTVAVLYLTLGAPFIALVQISVYAGAIMVLFLFVIMLLGAEQLGGRQKGGPLHLGISVLLALAFLIEVVLFVMFRNVFDASPLPALSQEFASPAAMGQLLFSRYLLPVEITSAILLSAAIGAIYLTRREERLRPGTTMPPNASQPGLVQPTREERPSPSSQ